MALVQRNGTIYNFEIKYLQCAAANKTGKIVLIIKLMESSYVKRLCAAHGANKQFSNWGAERKCSEYLLFASSFSHFNRNHVFHFHYRDILTLQLTPQMKSNYYYLVNKCVEYYSNNVCIARKNDCFVLEEGKTIDSARLGMPLQAYTMYLYLYYAWYGNSHGRK